jgi:hypothetical protein
VLPRLDTKRLAVFFLLLLPAVASLRQPLADPDIWWHLKAGEWIVAHRAVPHENLFSYTEPAHPWIAYSWLAEVLFYETTERLGFAALLELRTALVVATTGFIYLSCRAAGARWQAATTTSALAAMATFGGWAERPQLFTLLLLAFLVWGLHSPRPRSNLFWIAPLVVALWANLHIVFAGGVALLAAAGACEAIAGRPSRSLVLATLFSALASLANPYGWQLLAHVPTIASQPRIIRAIAEFQSPDFISELGTLVGAFLLFAIAVLGWSRERLSAFELVTFLGSLAMGLSMIRNMALFAILAAPTVARHLEAALPRRADAMPPPSPPWHWPLLLAGIALLGLLLPRGRAWQDKIERGTFPVAATDFVAAQYPNARVFNHFNWGGFLIYRLYPRARVSIDGRTAAYEPQTLDAYMRTQSLAAGWERFLEDPRPDVVLWPADHPLSVVLRRLPEWRVAFEDAVAVVFAGAAAAPRAPR